ncbi:MAG: RNA polymerase sigma factor [Saprospiraceae bacterium]|nr:RNA polymerase sigma factor [Saprospiraceae bacterium]
MTTEEDRQILEWLSDPNTLNKGFRVLVEKYQEKLYWQIRRMVLNHEDADDVLQNTFIKIFRNIGSFEGKSSLYTWMYRIAGNESLSFLEKQKRQFAESLDELATHPAILRLQADPYYVGDETNQILQRAILTLPEKQRQVFHLRYYDEMPYKEMSELLETSEGALKSSFHHAVKKIQEYVQSSQKNL